MSNITYLKKPDELSLTGNQMIFRIAGKNAFLSKSKAFKCSIDLYHWYTSPGHITFTWATGSVTFNCVPVPDVSGTQYPPANGIPDMAPWLNRNATLVKYFNIYPEENQNHIIIIEARNPGDEFQLSIESDQYPILTELNPAGSDVLQDFYRINVMVYQNSKVLTTLELPVEHAVDSDSLPAGFTSENSGIITLDISDFLQKTMNGHFTFPSLASKYSQIHNILAPFQVFAYEQYGTPPTEKAGLFSPILYYLQGKLGNFRQGELNDLRKTFLNKLLETGMFLTFAPAIKTTDIYAPERLYFIFMTIGNYTLKIKQYYSDGSTDIRDFISFLVIQYEVREFFISYDKIRTNAPKKLLKWDVYLTEAGGSTVSEVRTFVIDYAYQNHARYFIFKNSLGVYDTIRTTGKATKKFKNDKEIIRIPLPLNFSEIDRQENQISNVTTTTYNINSGYLSKEESDNFQQFVDSDDVYWIKRNKAYPVTLQNNSRTASEDEEFNPSSEFDLTHSIHDDFTEVFSANEPILTGDFSIDFNTDYFLGDIVVPDPESPQTTVLFHSDFSNWTDRTITPNGDNFTPLPYGLGMSDGNVGKTDTSGNIDNSSVVRQGDAARINVHGSFMFGNSGMPNTIFMGYSGTYMHVGIKYRISINVVELISDFIIKTSITVYGANNSEIGQISHSGQYAFETIQTQASIFRLGFRNCNCLIKDLLIEQIN